MLSSPKILQQIWDNKVDKSDLGDIFKNFGENGVALRSLMKECLYKYDSEMDWFICTEQGLKDAYQKVD